MVGRSIVGRNGLRADAMKYPSTAKTSKRLNLNKPFDSNFDNFDAVFICGQWKPHCSELCVLKLVRGWAGVLGGWGLAWPGLYIAVSCYGIAEQLDRWDSRLGFILWQAHNNFNLLFLVIIFWKTDSSWFWCTYLLILWQADKLLIYLLAKFL